MYAKDLSEPRYKFSIKKREDARIKHLHNPSAFIQYSSTMDDVYNNIDDYKPRRNKKNFIVFDGMVADIMTNERFQAIIKELFIRCRKINISPVFITQSYFSVSKEVRLNSTHYLIMKIHNNHSADIDSEDFLRIYRNCTRASYSFFTIDTALPADNPMRFRKNFSDSLL